MTAQYNSHIAVLNVRHCPCADKLRTDVDRLKEELASERAVMCVECEQVLDGGRCTNELCSGYSPRDDDQSCERVSGVCPKCGFDFSPPCERVTMGCCPKCCEHLGFKCDRHGCSWPDGEKACPRIMKASPEEPAGCW